VAPGTQSPGGFSIGRTLLRGRATEDTRIDFLRGFGHFVYSGFSAPAIAIEKTDEEEA
jgi:hypothetical protein